MTARRICRLAIGVMLVSLVGCAGSHPTRQAHARLPGGSGGASPAGVSNMGADISIFAGRLLGGVTPGAGSAVFSPFSISGALAMTLAGARGKTADEIKNALAFGLPTSRLHAAFNALTMQVAAING